MPDVIVDGHGNAFGDVAPDLGRVYGQSHHGTNRLRSSNPTVQNAMDSLDYLEGDPRRLLQQELGLNPPREMIDFFRNLDLDNKKDCLRVWKVMRGTLKNKAIATSLGVGGNQDLIKEKDIAIGKLSDELETTVVKANTKIQQLDGEISNLTGDLRSFCRRQKLMSRRI